MNATGMCALKVLAFYYRYLAAAEPLTDVVYGPKVRTVLMPEVYHL